MYPRQRDRNKILWAVSKFAVLHWDRSYETPLEIRQLCKWAHSWGLCTYETKEEVIISTFALSQEQLKERLEL